MAFASAAGYSNLPNGNFVPVVWSKKVQKFFRKISVAEDITNNDYYGEISNFGDTVRITLEPTITVTPYTRGQNMITQDLVDSEVTLTVDKANAFQFGVDDIEKKQAHLNWEPLAISSAAYSLQQAFDIDILTAMIAGTDSGNLYGSTGSPIDTGFGSNEVDPVNVIARLARILDDDNVPGMDRFLVGAPAFFEQLAQSSSKVMDISVTGDNAVTQLRNGQWSNRMVHGFKMYTSNNIPAPGGSATHTVLAGHRSSTATANQIVKTETFRNPNTFGDLTRGLHVYGKKVLRPTALAVGYLLID